MLGDRLDVIKYKIERGLVSRDSDLYFVYTLLMEKINETTREEVSHNERTDDRTPETVRSHRRRRLAEDRVREGSPLRPDAGDQENTTVEGG